MDEKNAMAIARRVEELRQSLELTYRDLAQQCNISHTTLLRYINGQIRAIPLDKLSLLAEALHTTPAYLMGWEDEEPKPIKRIGVYMSRLAKNPEAFDYFQTLCDIASQSDADAIKAAIAVLKSLKKEDPDA